MSNLKYFSFLLVFLLPNLSFAQSGQRISGPVIKDYGHTFAIENPDFKD